MNWLSLIGVSFSIITAIVNVIVLIAIKFNDLSHVQKELSEIKNTQIKTDEKLDLVSERVSKLEGKIS